MQTLRTSMESSTATNSSFQGKLLLVTQVQLQLSRNQVLCQLCRLKWLQWRLQQMWAIFMDLLQLPIPITISNIHVNIIILLSSIFCDYAQHQGEWLRNLKSHDLLSADPSIHSKRSVLFYIKLFWSGRKWNFLRCIL